MIFMNDLLKTKVGIKLSQEIEIEFKNLLTLEEFNRLKKRLQITDSDFFIQENHYFDTEDFSLKNLGCALRIREKTAGDELTLKEPAQEGLLETTQLLSSEEKEALFQQGPLPDGPVKEQLKKLNIPHEEISYFGSLTTERAENNYKGGIIVLDYSTYLNQHDFELEYEVTDIKIGHLVFTELLSSENIPIRKTANKIRRFYEAKKKLTD